jgi:asparagine synthase (glutamine-hydrolysing)
MCGIFGAVKLGGLPTDWNQKIIRMEEALIHRGPDDRGIAKFSNAIIGMRRLSIMDVAGGQQPFSSDDKQTSLVCNGEIYNYQELRKTLEHSGFQFRSHSDVETILHGYTRFGLDITSLLEGMFAFAIWDEGEQRLTLARDRFGIKPLYYFQYQDKLIFASELRALLASGEVPFDLDLNSLNQYLAFNYVPTPRSIVSNIKKLEPGTMLIFDSKGIITKNYSSLSFQQSESRPPLDPREVEHQFLDRFSGAVRRELASDVPIGVLLSGGLDSSTIAAIASKERPGISTFSVRFEDPTFDESSYAREVAGYLGTKHHELTVTEQMLHEQASSLGDILDEPLADSSFLPTSLLMRFVRKHVTVVLGGDGGDELFAGYPTHKAHRIIQLYESLVPFALRARVVPKMVKNLPVSLDYVSFDFKAKRFMEGRGVPFGVRHQIWMGAFSPNERSSILSPDLRLSTIDPYDPVHRLLAECDARELGNLALFLDMRLYLEGDILTKVDRSSMRASVEARVPFLNRHVADFALSLPYSLKLHLFQSKYLFRRAVKGIVPESVRTRKKRGFNFALGRYMRGSFRPLIEDTLRQDRVRTSGLFDPAGIDKILFEHQEGKVDHGLRIWNLFVFQSWLDSIQK